MKNTFRISFLTLLLVGQMFASYADRGAGKKKAKITFNIKAPVSFTSSLNFNLRNGLKYTGSFLSPVPNSKSNTFNFNTLITYQKGNSVYILPYKQKVLVADVRQGYAGAKLIIKMR